MTYLTLALIIMALMVFVSGAILIYLCYTNPTVDLYDPGEGYPYDTKQYKDRMGDWPNVPKGGEDD